MISVEFHDQLKEHCRVVRSAVAHLEYLSDVHSQAGNTKLAGQLQFLRDDLEESEKTLNKSYGSALHEAVCGVERNGRTILEAAMAGAKIAQENSP